MSENKRKAARTQGRFSNEREFRPTRRDKEKQNEQKGSRNRSLSPDKNERAKNPCRPAVTPEGIAIQYKANSTHTFTELTEVKHEEIREQGIRVLSETENGISRIIYEPDFICHGEVEELMDVMEKTVSWSDKNIRIRGKEIRQPRQVAWYGPLPYSYSGAEFDAAAMPDYILEIKAKIENFLRQYDIDVQLNSVLLNLYRNGNDSVAWHSDDELTMGISPTIASISLGAVRAFEMRPKSHVRDIQPTLYRMHLQPGSLLIMDGCMQQDWKHQVPKEHSIDKPRINLTFRTVYEIDKISYKVPHIETGNSSSNPNIAQPEHTYDPDSFPLLPPASNQQRKTYNKDVIFDTKQESIVQETTDIISANVEVADKSSIDDTENNLNKNITHSDRISNFSTHDETMNLNLSESAEASVPVILVDNECSSFVENEGSDPLEDNLEHKPFHEKEINHYEEVLNCPQDSVNNEQREKPCEANKHQLNANAPDFVPKSMGDVIFHPRQRESFCGRPLKELADIYLQSGVKSEDMKEFSIALIESLKHQKLVKDIFTTRDWFELDVLCKLSENGQNEKNQLVINDRICSLTRHASKYEDKMQWYHQKSYGSKNSYYKSSPHRY